MSTDRPTLRDVAAATGVSVAAASMALRGLPGVSDATRERVLEAARELRYEPNASARSLRTASYRSMGLLLPSAGGTSSYYAEFAFGVVDAAHERGWSVILLPRPADDAPATAHVDGFVIVDAAVGDATVDALLDDGRPVVSGERVTRSAPSLVASVAADHVSATTELLEHLSAAGARRIAALLPPADTAWGSEVAEACAAWCEQHGLPVLVATIGFEPDAREVEAATRRLLEDAAVDAILTVPSGTAGPVAAAAARGGRRVGDDLLLAAYVDEPALSLLTPQVTALDLHEREHGARCATELIDALTG
ncbi:MAG: LacI family DNA-binding transcriptional regulator, partial [Agrococcus sp.]